MIARELQQQGKITASVIIATRNKATYLDLTLASLERQILPSKAWEVVVVDDASSDDTPAVLDKYEQRAKLQLVRQCSAHCRQRAGARNDAIQLAQGRVLVFLDDRIMASDYLIRHLVHHLSAPCVVIGDVGTRIHTHLTLRTDPAMRRFAYLLKRTLLQQSSNRVPRTIFNADDLDAPEIWGPLSFMPHSDYPLYVEVCNRKGLYWAHFTTGNASVLRDQVLSACGFDERFQGWGFEDSDLAIRLQQAGLPFRFEPRAFNLHQVHPEEATKSAEHKRNMNYFFLKHPDINREEMEPLFSRSISMTQWLTYQRGELARQTECVTKIPVDHLRILWCICGKGLAKAIRGAALLNELQRLYPEVQVRIITYGPAARWLQDCQFSVEELHSNATNSPQLRFAGFTRLIRHFSPNLIISDEELLVLPIAQAANIPTIYLTSRIEDEHQSPDHSYAHCADHILFADLPGSFPIPSNFYGKVKFYGPWVETFVTQEIKTRWRTLLEAHDRPLIIIAADEDFIADEQSIEHIAFIVNGTRAALAQPSRPRLVVLGGGLTERLAASSCLPEEALLLDIVPDRSQLFQSADLVVTGGEHSTLWQLAAAGVPTIVVPPRGEKHLSLTENALRMAKLGSCVYLPEVAATLETFQTVIGQVLNTNLGATMRGACIHIDFAARRREAIDYFIKTATKKTP